MSEETIDQVAQALRRALGPEGTRLSDDRLVAAARAAAEAIQDAQPKPGSLGETLDHIGDLDATSAVRWPESPLTPG